MSAIFSGLRPGVALPQAGPASRQLPNWSLTAADERALDSALLPTSIARPSDVLILPREIQPFVVLGGWAALQRTTGAAATQILSFFLPGDVVGLETATSPMADGEIVALTAMRLRRFRREGRAGLADAPGLVRSIATQNLQHQARLQDQVLRLGAMSAVERMAHLLAELDERLRRGAGSTKPQALPVRQEILAQALGLSLVHVNRTLRQLRALGLARIDRGCLIVPDRLALLAATPESKVA